MTEKELDVPDVESEEAEESADVEQVLDKLRALVNSAVTEIEQAKSVSDTVDRGEIGEILLPLGHDFKLKEHMEHIERRYTLAALHQTNGHILQAADLLGMTYRHLRYRMGKLGIEKKGRKIPGARDDARDVPSLLFWLLDYELRNAARHQTHVSLLMVADADAQLNLAKFIATHMRKSDAFFDIHLGGAILMGKTTFYSALEAVERYRGLCPKKADLRWGLASYPRDGKTSRDIYEVARRRMIRAKGTEFGAVVTEG